MLVDSSYLYALSDRSDKNHHSAVGFLTSLGANWAVPMTTLPEVCYLLESRISHRAMRDFAGLLAADQVPLVEIKPDAWRRVSELLAQYADTRLGFVDATIVAMAELLDVIQIATFDRRHFRIIRPRHCPAFELLP
jgi:predicted nucleic acid-binding protein